MAITVYFKKESKRRNSTLQFALNSAQQFSCVLKSATSVDRPTFLLSTATFDYNLAYWGGRYYFVENVTSVRDNQWEVSCVIDVLATFKSGILVDSQFITYADATENLWRPDRRRPVSAEPTFSVGTASYSPGALPFNSVGFYVLTVTGTNGTRSYMLSQADINDIIMSLNSWVDGTVGEIVDGSRMSYTYDFSTVENAMEALSKMTTQAGILGNAYSNAPANIQSCIFVPLNGVMFATGVSARIYLGAFDTGITASQVDISPVSDTIKVPIPWQAGCTGWKRAENTSVSLYLPFVGSVTLPSDEIAKLTDIYVEYHICALDGKILYRILTASGGACIATYTANCGTNYSIGINQQASLGETLQTGIEGVSKTISTAIDSSVSPVSMAGAATGAIFQGAITAYNVADITRTHRSTTIGNMAGSVWRASDFNFSCVVTTYQLIDQFATNHTKTRLGVPIMQVDFLNNYTGYVQCANAHANVSGNAYELDAIDMYLNSGFYIE